MDDATTVQPPIPKKLIINLVQGYLTFVMLLSVHGLVDAKAIGQLNWLLQHIGIRGMQSLPE